jgi:hypothetical protein
MQGRCLRGTWQASCHEAVTLWPLHCFVGLVFTCATVAHSVGCANLLDVIFFAATSMSLVKLDRRIEGGRGWRCAVVWVWLSWYVPNALHPSSSHCVLVYLVHLKCEALTRMCCTYKEPTHVGRQLEWGRMYIVCTC